MNEAAAALRRVFFALRVGEPGGAELARGVRRALGGGAARDWRLARGGGLHLTLVFLGDVAEAALAGLVAAARAGVAGRAAPRLVVDRTGAFPRFGAERVLWLGVHEDPAVAGRLADLRRVLVAALLAAGIDLGHEGERAFRPHVTVARPRARGPRRVGAPASFRDWRPELTWRPSELELMESVRGDGPARYETLARLPLEDPPGGS